MSDTKVIRVLRVYRRLQAVPLVVFLPAIAFMAASVLGMDSLFCHAFAKKCALGYSLSRISAVFFVVAILIAAAVWPMALASTAEIHHDRIRVKLFGFSRELQSFEIYHLWHYRGFAQWCDLGGQESTIRLWVNFFEDPELAVRRISGWHEINRRRLESAFSRDS